MSYGLKECSLARPDLSEPEGEPDVYELFKESLDRALRDLAGSNGENFEAAERAYNELWPDGLMVRISRDPDGGFLAVFSSGKTLSFRDFDDLGSALLIMRDRALFEKTRAQGPAQKNLPRTGLPVKSD